MHILLVSSFELDTRYNEFFFCLLGDRQVNYFHRNSERKKVSKSSNQCP